MVCDVNKIDSNVTGLAYAEEACLKVLPTLVTDGFDPTWYGLEPNSYSDFGGDLATVARQPISATRQRKKGTVTGLEASGGFNTDLTQTNLTRLMQGFFFANARQKAATKLFGSAAIALTSIATTDDSFNAASGLDRFKPQQLVKVSKSVSNNGLHKVVSAVAAKLVVTTNLTDETPTADAQIEAVGFEFDSGVVSMTASAAAAALVIAGLAAATGTLTFSGVGTAADTVTIGSKVYTLRAIPAVANDVLIGASATATAANLVAAINGATGAGTLYGVGTVANTQVTASNVAGVITVTAIWSGVSANSIATTESGTATAWGAATLAGGTGDIGWKELGIIPGEWVFVGDAVGSSFTETASTNRPGYARAISVTNSTMTFDQTTWTPQADAGTGKTIRVFFGTVIRNEPLAADIVTRSYNLERTLGKDSSELPQSQYLEGAIANEFTLNYPEGDKLNADLTFIALNDATRTGLEGLKGGARVAAPGESAFNTSLDIYRVYLAVLDSAEMNKEALFAYVTEADVTINNNATLVTALGVLGGIDVSVGNFDAGGSVTALFSTVESIRAIRNNADVGLNFIAARANGGFIFDIPLLGLGGGRLNVELNTPITVPLEAAGAENSLGYTMLSNWFPYLPNVAMPV